MTILNQVKSGIAVLAIMAISTVFITDHMETSANTEYRLNSKDGEILKLLAQIKANQGFLMRRYESEVNGK